MIEVEKKFQPTKEQLEKLLEGAEFLGEKHIHDLYYDYPDLRIYKSKDRLRKRDSGYEMKISMEDATTTLAVAREIENDAEIKEFLKISDDPRILDAIVMADMQPVCDFTTKRLKYKKEGFNIDVDETSFGYNVCEIERIVESNQDIQKAEEEIIGFAQKFGLEIKDMPLKSKAYLQTVRPEVYEQLKEYL